MSQFNYRIGAIEARTSSHNSAMEIVQWSEDMCWSIVSFVPGSSGWDAVLLGNRPFDERVNWHHLRQLIQASYDFLSEA